MQTRTDHECAHNCAEFSDIIQHKTVLIIYPLILLPLRMHNAQYESICQLRNDKLRPCNVWQALLQ